MTAIQVSSVLTDVASYINQDPTAPTGTDLTMWINLVNQAQNEWADVYQWKQLRNTINLTVNLSQVSFGLPANFKKMMSPVYDYSVGPNQPTQYYEIPPQQRFQAATTDKYVYILGNAITGYSLNLNPAAASGASLVFDIQTTVSSLATGNDTVTCPSQQYLSLRTMAKILSARSDPRFPQVYSESQNLLSSMMEEEASLSGGTDNTVPNQYHLNNFRIGES